MLGHTSTGEPHLRTAANRTDVAPRSERGEPHRRCDPKRTDATVRQSGRWAGVTAPREILPGSTWLISRCCTQRHFLLRPDAETNAIFAYCLAEASMRYGVGIIAWTVMSNHYHAVVHDPLGVLPKFVEHLHKYVAKVMNARLGRWENFWATEETCMTRLASPEDVFRKVVYVLSNPVADNLVERAADWPGCTSIGQMAGDEESTHDRPPWFFRPNGVMPAKATLKMSVPSAVLGSESESAWRKRVLADVAQQEALAATERRRTAKPVLGRRAVLSMSVHATPTAATPRRMLRPSLAAANRETRLAELQRLTEFRSAYAIARDLYRRGDHTIEFPPGTYRMRLLGARCKPIRMAA